MLTQSPSIPRQLFIETWNESCIQKRDILATTATIQSTEIPGKPTTHSQWNLASGPSDFQWDHGKVPYETPFQFYRRISLLPQQVLPAAFQEVNTMFNSPSPLEYMMASWALPWPIVQLHVSYRKSPWFSSSLSSPLSSSSLLREPKISIETASSAKQKWCHEMPPLIPWDCHSIGQIGMAVSRYKMQDTTVYLAPSPLSDKYAERIAKGKRVVHHPPSCEEKFDMAWSSPFLVSKYLLPSGPSFHSTASPWDHPGTVPLLSRQPAYGYQHPETSSCHACLHAHKYSCITNGISLQDSCRCNLWSFPSSHLPVGISHGRDPSHSSVLCQFDTHRPHLLLLQPWPHGANACTNSAASICITHLHMLLSPYLVSVSRPSAAHLCHSYFDLKP